VPVTISGARTLFPTRGFPALGFGEITVTVHDPIPTAGREVDELMREAHDAIAQALRPCDMLPPPKGAAEPQAAGLKQE
jgi:1-acyl-sn-glycerol-3-phosphate acyltransferase